MSDQVQRYRKTMRCTDCGHKFWRIVHDPEELPPCQKCTASVRNTPALGDGAVSDNDVTPVERDRTVKGIWKCESVSCGERFACSQWSESGEAVTPKSCPVCGHEKVKFLETTAPRKITEHAQHVNKAVDITAETTMHNYGMTDLKDNVGMGETMAPSLRPDLQKQADSFFSGKGVHSRNNELNNQVGNIMRAQGARAMAGHTNFQKTPEAGIINSIRDTSPGFKYTPIAVHAEGDKR